MSMGNFHLKSCSNLLDICLFQDYLMLQEIHIHKVQIIATLSSPFLLSLPLSIPTSLLLPLPLIHAHAGTRAHTHTQWIPSSKEYQICHKLLSETFTTALICQCWSNIVTLWYRRLLLFGGIHVHTKIKDIFLIKVLAILPHSQHESNFIANSRAVSIFCLSSQ